jgi:hypothetical protein
MTARQQARNRLARRDGILGQETTVALPATRLRMLPVQERTAPVILRGLELPFGSEHDA